MSNATWIQKELDRTSNERCDFDILLRDKHRHVFSLRDHPRNFRPYDEHEFSIELDETGESGTRPIERLKAEVVLALHLLLDAYGYGSVTAVAVIDAFGSEFGETLKVFPSLIDHSELVGKLCSDAILDLEAALANGELYVSDQHILRRGHFDLVVVLADNEVSIDLDFGPIGMILNFDRSKPRLTGRFMHSLEMIDHFVPESLADLLRVILFQLVGRTGKRIEDLELQSEAERRKVAIFNATEGGFATDVRLEELFEAAVRKTPKAIALCTDELTLGYDQLNRRVNRFAHWLLSPAARLEEGQFVGLFMDKSSLPVITTVALWKVGATCVPIDPASPIERVLTIVKETGLSLMIANERYADELRRALVVHGLQVIVVAVEAVSELSADCQGDDLRLQLSSDRPAYVMYTSGTTGVPKCVAKLHVSVVNSITDLSERYGMTAAPGEERVVLFSGCGFEPFMRQILLALINSQTLVIVPDNVRLDPQRFPQFLARHEVTHLNGTGSVLRTFDFSRCPTLKRLALVGEELTTAVLRDLRSGFSGTIFNEYAFTEATFVTALKEFGPEVSVRVDRSIGRPLRNVTWYVLDKHKRQLPIGAIGELYVGGRGIADGYLNNVSLTNDRFFENPFVGVQESHERGNGLLYGTGDLARMLPNGEVEFLGRRDFQLKLNGVRIEPGEIETRVGEYPGIQRCVVVPKTWPVQPGTSSLIGFYTVESGAKVQEQDLRSFLKTRLIPVMIPGRMIALEAFPVTSNGKVDWRSLQALASDQAQLDNRTDGYSADGRIRDLLKEIWAEVLNLPKCEVRKDDDFFGQGGQSISSIMLVARIRERIGRDIRVKNIFGLSTFDAIASFLEDQPELNAASSGPEDTARNGWMGSMQFAAHGLQQGLYYHALNAEVGDDTYIMQVVHRYRTPMRADLMEIAWRHAYARFPALRLRFVFSDKPVQVLDDTPSPMDWRVIDLDKGGSARGTEDALGILLHRERHSEFNIEAGPLFRVLFVREAADRFALIFTCHHIILDGWSLSLLHEEVHQTYLDLLFGRSIRTGKDMAFLDAQKHWEGSDYENRHFWTEQLARIEGGCDLRGLLKPEVRGLTDLAGYTRVKCHKTRQFRLGSGSYASLRARCAESGLTMHSALQFALHSALHAFGGGSQTVVGTISSGRVMPVPGIERAVGPFINTLPVIVDHRSSDANRTVAETMVGIQHSTTVLNDRSIVNFAELESDGLKRRVFNALLMYESLSETADEIRHREILKFDRSRDVNKVDHPLQMVAREDNKCLEIGLWYAGELFDEEMIGRFMDTVARVLEQVAGNMSMQLSDLRLITEETLRDFDHWNDTEESFPHQATLIDVFEEVVEHWADEPALVFRDARLSYRELNERANHLAHLITSHVHLQADDLVAIAMDKSDWMIAAILAVWKSGAAFVPVDPSFPQSRIEFILDDTSARLVLTDPDHWERLSSLRRSDQPEVSFDLIAPQQTSLDAYPNEGPERTLGSNNLAYAIYTSGTTGQPKAVLVEHRGVVNLHHSLSHRFSLDRCNGKQVFLSFSNFVFDHFVEQMTDALLNGHTLVVLDDNLRTDNEALRRCIRENCVTYLSGTPSVLSMYDYSGCMSLKYIDAVGEDFSRSTFERIRQSFNGTIINGYGPTEISITSHKRPYAPTETRDNKSIGVPVANTTCYILDSLMRRIPIGGIGELYIGGMGVTRGYLNRDDLTSERFIPDWFAGAARSAGRVPRLYRTGDLCRWLPNGEIEYLGRIDTQVKVNGQRIELSEIEGALLSHPDVDQAVVIVRERPSGKGIAGEENYLAAFFVAARELEVDDLLAWLRNRLPAALIPSRLTRIERVPVTPSGKLDVRLLPSQFLPDSGRRAEPKTLLERDLRRIWSEVLACEASSIGTDDNFFALGGDSLRAIKLAVDVTSRLSKKLSLHAAFEHATIEAQARYLGSIETSAPADTENHVTAALSTAPISSAQAALLYMDELFGGTSAYNIPLFLAVDSQYVSADAVIAALQFLFHRHEALRTRIRLQPDGSYTQDVVAPDKAIDALNLNFKRLEDRRDLDDMCRDLADHVFELGSQLPVTVNLFCCDDDPSTLHLCLVFHHVCFDGWSLAIFRRELRHLLCGGEQGQLLSPSASYREFAEWERQQIDQGAFDPSIEFWRKKLVGLPLLDLPKDRPRPAVFDHRGFETRFRFPPGIGNDLKELARSTGVSLYTVLLAASAILLKVYSGQHDLAIGTPAANRIDTRFDSVIGLFANLIVLRIGVENETRLDSFLKTVAGRVAEAQPYQSLPFDRIVKALELEPDASFHPLFQALVTLMPPGAEEEGMSAGPLRDYEPRTDSQAKAKFDLSLAFADTTEGLSGTLTLPTALYDPETAAAIVATLETITRDIARVATDPGSVTVGDIRGVDESACSRHFPSEASVTPAPSGWPTAGAQSLPELFETVVEAHQTLTAIECEDRQLTYADLNHMANRLTNSLLESGSASGERIAILMDKSEDVVISILAVWKAGGAYVPLDPTYPDDRIAFILDDAEIGRIITDSRNSAKAERLAGSRIPVLEASRTTSTEMKTISLDVRMTDPAYVIYTSGTSGRPKGVQISHGNLLSFHCDLVRHLFGTAHDTQQAVLLTSNVVFDFSLEQLCLSILSGHRLVIEPSDILSEDTYDRLNSCGLSYLSGTPTQILRYDLAKLKHLKWVLLAGEAIKSHQFDNIRKNFCGTIFTAYGTTETTVYNTVRRFETGEPFVNDLGVPLPNTRLVILDDSMHPVPDGACGQVFVIGPCVGLGYLNRPELDAQRFGQQLIGTRSGERFFATGDLARYHPSGRLEFWGRNDTQVKIGGVRIEPGEIEATLCTFPGIDQCAVLPFARADGRTQLVAYYIVDHGSAALRSEDIEEHLLKSLPRAMVPVQFVQVPGGSFPTTVNGKLDLVSLPRPEQCLERTAQVPPRNPHETQLCELFSELLGGRQVGIDDDFFKSGGDSIAALQLAARLRGVLGTKVDVKWVFDHPTVRRLSDFAFRQLPVPAQNKPSHQDTCELATSDPVRLTPIQEWFFSKKLVTPNFWNQEFAIRTPTLDPVRLCGALDRLSRRHDAFELRFTVPEEDGGSTAMVVAGAPRPIKLRKLDVGGVPREVLRARLNAWQSAFDLVSGPMATAAYLHGFEDGSARVWFAMHHLIVDRVSWSILLDDLEALYHGNDPVSSGTSFRKWARVVRRYVPSPDETRLWDQVVREMSKHQSAWRPIGTDGSTETLRFVAPTAWCDSLLELAAQQGAPEFRELLLAVIGVSVCEVNEIGHTYLAVENHGREAFTPQIDVGHTIGWFTTIHPVRVEASHPLKSAVMLKEWRRQVPYNGLGYGTRGVLGEGNAPLPSFSVNFLGRLTPSGEGVRCNEGGQRWTLDSDMVGLITAPEDRGRMPGSVDITAWLSGGELVISMESALSDNDTAQLFERMKENLRLLRECRPSNLSEFTPASSGHSCENRSAPGFEPMIVIEKDTEGPYLYVLPPGEGGAESYLRNLSPQIRDLNQILFNNIHLLHPQTSFEDIGSYYLDLIHKRQDTGPYHLMGWSFGGVVALELALRLAGEGKRVENLILIDPLLRLDLAEQELALKDISRVIDPINLSFTPSSDSLKGLTRTVGRVTLYKAEVGPRHEDNDDRRRLFDYYAASTHNNLDTLIPRHLLSVRSLGVNDHFSWVSDDALVERMGAEIRTLVYPGKDKTGAES